MNSQLSVEDKNTLLKIFRNYRLVPHTGHGIITIKVTKNDIVKIQGTIDLIPENETEHQYIKHEK
jgi:hypothetical protein